MDLLVPHQRLEQTVRTLRSLGYREPGPDILETGATVTRNVRHHVHLRGGPQQRIAVELHWNLVAGDGDWRTPPLEWFWLQAEPFSPRILPDSLLDSHPSVSLLTLSPGAHLLYLAAHLMLQHPDTQARLLWFYDIHLLISRWRERMQWNELLERAREFQWASALRAALQGVQERFATPLPEGFLDALAQHSDDGTAQPVLGEAVVPRTRAINAWARLATLDWQTRLRLIWITICPKPAYMRWRYKPQPAWLWPLYYPYRWFDTLRDGLATLWQMGKGKMEEGKWKGE